MANRRLQVESGISPAELKITAAPTDPFVRTNEGNQLEQLAQGLSKLDPAFSTFSNVLSEQKAKRDLAAGKQRARELFESSKAFKKAVNEGRISPDQSPWFMAGLREEFGRLAADQWNSDFIVAAADKLRDSTSLAEFDAFFSEHRTKWVEDNIGAGNRDQHFERGFGGLADSYAGASRQEFARQVSARVVNQANEVHFGRIKNSVEFEWGRGTDSEAIAAALNQLNTDRIAAGVNPRQINQTTVAAVVAAARRMNDASILRVLDHVTGGSGPLANTSYGSEAIEAAENEIASQNQSQYNRDNQRQNDAKVDAVDGLLREAVEALEGSETPHRVDLKNIRARLTALDPKAAESLLRLQDAYSDRSYQDDPDVRASAFLWVHGLDPARRGRMMRPADAAQLLAEKQITVPTFQSLLREMEQRDTSGGANRFFNDDGLKAGQRIVRSLFVSEFGFEGPEMRWRAAQAEVEFTASYLRWRQGEGLNATPNQVTEFIQQQANEIFPSKSTTQSTRDFSRIPQANLGPQKPDPATQLVTDPTNISMLESEFDELLRGARNSLSLQALAILQYAGIPPIADNIQEFLVQQRRLVPTFVAPDSQ